MNCPVCGENNVCYECMNADMQMVAEEGHISRALEYFATEPKKINIASGEDFPLELEAMC